MSNTLSSSATMNPSRPLMMPKMPFGNFTTLWWLFSMYTSESTTTLSSLFLGKAS